jgi:sensor histidine kinase YesM
MKPLDNIKLRLIGPLILYLLGIVIFRFQVYFEGAWETRLRYFVIAFVYHFICWHIARWAVMKVQNSYPGLDALGKRLRILLIGVLPVLTFLGYALRRLTHQIILDFPDPIPTMSDFATGMGAQLFYHSIYISVYEGLYLIYLLRKTHQEKEELIKVQWQSRFDSLKNQVNPHFLFNSLNTLTVLIQENPKQAEYFVEEMSKVYRYLLQNNQNEMTTVGIEMRFLESYFHLLKTRFSEGLFLKMDIPPQYLDYLIPPLTLQILLENAIKHNIVSANKPLTIHVFIEKNTYLVVSNNIQHKQIAVRSEGVGLVNISAKYRLLGLSEVVISEADNVFSVKLPLIKNEVLSKIVD